jgi:hypothetical protein
VDDYDRRFMGVADQARHDTSLLSVGSPWLMSASCQSLAGWSHRHKMCRRVGMTAVTGCCSGLQHVLLWVGSTVGLSAECKAPLARVLNLTALRQGHRTAGPSRAQQPQPTAPPLESVVFVHLPTAAPATPERSPAHGRGPAAGGPAGFVSPGGGPSSPPPFAAPPQNPNSPPGGPSPPGGRRSPQQVRWTGSITSAS